jgi:2-polyprenyl-3-methyl-5-hydroxy-6-metoxy-1,4-benzoquinol methylase
MNDLKKRVDDSSNFYRESILGFDYQLATYNFESLKPFFKGKTALELGPASGYMTKLLVEEFESLHLVEGSESLLQEIPEYPNVTKYHSLFEEFETTQKYDTIIMSHVLEHIENPSLVLKKIYNWLADDGVFLVSVPNAKSIHRLVAVQMGMLTSEYELNSRDHELGHFRVYDMNALSTQMTEAGFKVQDTGGVFLKPLSNGQIETNWTPEMIEGFYKVGKYFQEYCAEIFVVCTK